jgi:hypothetical protein
MTGNQFCRRERREGSPAYGQPKVNIPSQRLSARRSVALMLGRVVSHGSDHQNVVGLVVSVRMGAIYQHTYRVWTLEKWLGRSGETHKRAVRHKQRMLVAAVCGRNRRA